MSQTSKRPGSRDISDLKARLGLKKPGGSTPSPQSTPSAGAVISPPGASVPMAPSQVPAPPGMSTPSGGAMSGGAMSGGAMSGGAIPVPPGMQVPATQNLGGVAPQQPAYSAPAPDIVVINDGQPVANLTSESKGASIAKTALLILGPLIAGVFIGKMAASAGSHNQVLSDAVPILKDVETIRRALTELSSTLEAGKKEGVFPTGDAKLTEALKILPAIEGNDKQVFDSALYTIGPNVAEIYGFYADLHTLERERREHIQLSKKEAKIISDGLVKIKGFNPMRFGAVVTMPNEDEARAGKPVTMRMVQLGKPICKGETAPNPAGCTGPLAGFQYQTDQTGPWRTTDLSPAGKNGKWENSLLMLQPTKTLEQIIKGGSAYVAEAAYTQRVLSIEALTNRLLDSNKKIKKFLTLKSNESTKFSFFL